MSSPRGESPIARRASFGDITEVNPMPRLGDGKVEESGDGTKAVQTRKLYELMSSYLSNGAPQSCTARVRFARRSDLLDRHVHTCPHPGVSTAGHRGTHRFTCRVHCLAWVAASADVCHGCAAGGV